MKKLVQFNELVFTGLLKEQPEIETSFKSSKQSFTGNHGDYNPVRCGSRKVNSKTFSVELFINKSKFPCEARAKIEQFITDNLNKIGRLWAVDNDVLMWAWAQVDNYSVVYEESTELYGFTATFYIASGVWNIAKDYETYIDDYNICHFDICYEALERDICDCCLCHFKKAPERKCPPCKGLQLCKIPKNSLSNVLLDCGDTKRISYSCSSGKPDITFFSKDKRNVASTDFFVKTLYPTDDVVIEIFGSFNNLVLRIDGERILKINGAYTGRTIISGGVVENYPYKKEVSFKIDTACCYPDSCDSKHIDFSKVETCGGGLAYFELSKGTHNIYLSGFDSNDIQKVNVYVGGVAI